MEISDKYTLIETRRLIQERSQRQIWYYSGANSDITPTLLAPLDSKHWWVDPAYDGSHRFHRNSLGEEITAPFAKLGAATELETNWEDAWRQKKQEITVDRDMSIHLVGKQTQESDTTPGIIDVIYTNAYSTTPDPKAFINLRKDGLYVVVDDSPSGKKSKLDLPGRQGNLIQMGFQEIYTKKMKLHFPALGVMHATTNDKDVTIHIYEKTRNFFPEEEDLLHLDSSLWEINYVFDDFVFRFDTGNLPISVSIQLEDSLRSALTRFRERLISLKAMKNSNPGIVDFFESTISGYFTSEDELPKRVIKNYYYNVRDQNKVRHYYKQAQQIYRELQQKLNPQYQQIVVENHVVIRPEDLPTSQSPQGLGVGESIVVRPEPEITLLSPEAESLHLSKSNTIQDLERLERADIRGGLSGEASQFQVDYGVIKDIVERKLGDLYVVRDEQGRVLGFSATHAYEIITMVVDQSITHREMKREVSRLLLEQMKRDVGHGLYIGRTFLTDADRRFLSEQGFEQGDFQYSYNQ